MPTTRLTLVLPCLNEESAVGTCVARAHRLFHTTGLDGTVLVVDNGSTDCSAELAKEAGARVVTEETRGYGAALRTGIEEAETGLVVIADADGTYELEAIPRLIEPVTRNEADVVIGSRLRNIGDGAMPWLHRYVGTPVVSMLVNRAAGKKFKVRDTQSGFRAFRRDQIIDLGLTSTGMEYASEMLIRSARACYRVLELPTTYSPRIGASKFDTFADGIRHVHEIFLLSRELRASSPRAKS